MNRRQFLAAMVAAPIAAKAAPVVGEAIFNLPKNLNGYTFGVDLAACHSVSVVSFYEMIGLRLFPYQVEMVNKLAQERFLYGMGSPIKSRLQVKFNPARLPA